MRTETRRSIARVAGTLAFFAAAFALYRPALSGPFLSDDFELIVDNPYVHAVSLENVRAILDPTGEASFLVSNYAPVHLLVHTVAWSAFGAKTFGHHVVGVALHVLATLLLVAVWFRFGAPEVVAWFAGAIFLVHPANVEAVAWISEQKTTAAACLAFASLALFERRPAGWLACFGLALLAKAQAVFAWPVAATRAWLARDRRKLPWLVAGTLVVAAFAAVELPIYYVMGEVDEPLPAATRIRVVFGVIGHYAEMALFGTGIGWQQEPPAPEWGDARCVVGVALTLVGLARATFALRRSRVEAVYWAWLVGAFAPVSQWTPFPHPVADRYLYFILPALLGLGVTWFEGLSTTPARRRALAVSGLVAIVWFASLGAERVPLFQSEDRLRDEAVARFPRGQTAAFLAAQLAAERGDRDQALAALEHVRDLGGTYFLVISEDPRFAFLGAEPRYRAVIADLAGRALVHLNAQRVPNQLQQRTIALAHLARGESDLAIGALRRARDLGGRFQQVVEFELLRLELRQRLRAS